MNEMEAGAESRGREALIWDLKQKLETMTEERDTLRAIIDHIHYCPSPDHVSPAAVECTKYDRAMELLAHSMAARASLDLQVDDLAKKLAGEKDLCIRSIECAARIGHAMEDCLAAMGRAYDKLEWLKGEDVVDCQSQIKAAGERGRVALQGIRKGDRNV